MEADIQIPDGPDAAEITLYVAGAAGRAADTVERVRADADSFGSRVALTVVDVLDDPARAEADGILTTPMLVRWHPAPVRRLTGDFAGVASMLPSQKGADERSQKDEERRSRLDRRKSSFGAAVDREAEGAVISRAAHELRTPLSVIMGFASMLVGSVSEMDRETGLKCAEAIVRGSMQLQTILDSMLVMDQVERDGLRLDLLDLHLGTLVLETVRDLQPLTAKHSISVDVLEESEVRADASKVRQVLTNLISNAAKFSPEGSSIKVTVDAREECGSVTVTDGGPGIPEDAFDRVFEQYERLGSSEKGMGLGLYISRRLALAHGGDLTASNIEEAGACFELTLPYPPA